MDAREKAIEEIANVIRCNIRNPMITFTEDAEEIIRRPELEAYFREKFENEPGRLVAEKECAPTHKTYCISGCELCNGTGIITRRMTRKEVEEWAYKIALYHGQMNYCLPIDGERVSVEER